MNIGSDKVCFEDDRVLIHAAMAMDWPLREFCRVPIYFQDRKYFLAAKHKGERPYAMVYELWAWPGDGREASNNAILYDEAYVMERDQSAATGRRGDRWHLILLPFYPFLGLFWSGLKTRVLGEFGFEPSSITKASNVLVFNAFLLQGIFTGWLGGGLFAHLLKMPLLDYAFLLLLGLDALMRCAQSLKDDVDSWWGFCEWLWPGKK